MSRKRASSALCFFWGDRVQAEQGGTRFEIHKTVLDATTVPFVKRRGWIDVMNGNVSCEILCALT